MLVTFGTRGAHVDPKRSQVCPKGAPVRKTTPKATFSPPPPGQYFDPFSVKTQKKQIQEGKGLQKTHQNQDPFSKRPSNEKRLDFRPPGPSKTKKPLEGECNVAKTTKYGPGSIFSQF